MTKFLSSFFFHSLFLFFSIKSAIDFWAADGIVRVAHILCFVGSSVFLFIHNLGLVYDLVIDILEEEIGED